MNSENPKVLTYILRDEHFKVDELGNYIDYLGLEDNEITENDDLAVAQEKVYAQEHWLIEEKLSDMSVKDWYIQYLTTSSMNSVRRF